MAGILSVAVPAIYTKLTTSNDFNTAMGSRVFFEEYKTTNGSLPVTMPYAVFFVVSDVNSYTFTSEYSDLIIQVDIFDNGSSASTMLTNISKLHALLDDAALTITGWTTIRLKRELSLLRQPDAEGIRMASSGYRLSAQKS